MASYNAQISKPKAEPKNINLKNFAICSSEYQIKLVSLYKIKTYV